MECRETTAVKPVARVPRGAGRLAVDVATFEAHKAECHSTGRDDAPLRLIHRTEVAGEFAPSVDKITGERECGENGGFHDEPSFLIRVSSSCNPGIPKPSLQTGQTVVWPCFMDQGAGPRHMMTTCSANLGHGKGKDSEGGGRNRQRC